ncbi:MAG TPA: Imm26 family immunity protein [Chitinophagaceae bacterium]|nr:Imm26 family immunity protein [Chitinophagaceae bacterium]
MKIKNEKGDVFKMILPKGYFGYGQIIDKRKNTITVVIYKSIYLSEQYSLDAILTDDILFLYNTFDVFIEMGKWVIIDNCIDNLTQIVLPYYLIGLPPNAIVEDFYRNKVRNANEDDIKNIDYRGTAAPINIVNAFMDFHKIILSKTNYDDLFYDNAS